MDWQEDFCKAFDQKVKILFLKGHFISPRNHQSYTTTIYEKKNWLTPITHDFTSKDSRGLE